MVGNAEIIAYTADLAFAAEGNEDEDPEMDDIPAMRSSRRSMTQLYLPRLFPDERKAYNALMMSPTTNLHIYICRAGLELARKVAEHCTEITPEDD